MRPVCSIVTVATSGTIVPLTTDQSISVNQIFIQPHPANGAGPYYVGNSTLVASTYAGVIYLRGGVSDSFSQPQSQNGMNQLSPANYFLDSPNSGDKFLVTWWIS